MNSIRLVILFWTLSLFVSAQAFAQLIIQDPAPAVIPSCDDLATIEYGNPWDMSDSADINNFFPGNDVIDITNASFSDGVFSATTSGSNDTLFLFSPRIPGEHGAGRRFGEAIREDIARFHRFTIRMYTDVASGANLGFLWPRSSSYAADRSAALYAAGLEAGWHTYTMDFNSLTLWEDTTPWNAGPITGLALRPTSYSGANLMIDWIRLEDPDSCSGSGSTFSYSATSSGGNNLVNIYLDDDSNPFNGYVSQLVTAASASGAASTGISSALGIYPASYNVVGLLYRDYATLEMTNPWDFSDDSDVIATQNITGASYSSGVLSGSSSTTSPLIHLQLGDDGIDTSKYRYLSFKLTRSSDASNIWVIWDGGGRAVTGADLVGDSYRVDLGSSGTWTGTKTYLRIQPASASGVNFNLDFVGLSSTSTYITSLSTSAIASTAVTASLPLIVNNPPSLRILEPDEQGGEAIRPWNMINGDMLYFRNLAGEADVDNPGENLTSYLPDVRAIDDLRGDFFKATNVEGSDDPVNFSVLKNANSSLSVPAEYRNFCFRMLIDYPFILTGLDGSMARVVWKEAGAADYESSGAWLVTPDGWSSSRWFEMCDDLATLESDAVVGNSTWDGTMYEFRLDAHEIRSSATYYYDYLKLRRDDRSSNGLFNIIYDLSDAEDDPLTFSLYYNSTATTTGGTLIATGLSANNHHYTWDTSAVPDGTYYVYGVTDDGTNETRTLAGGRLVVSNQGSTAGNNPVLLVQAPQDTNTICSSMQVKGYALQTDRYEDVAGVEVLLDGTALGVIRPHLYSPAAVAAYPSADSSLSGFDQDFDISSFADGVHTLTLRALSTDSGSTEQQIEILKAGAGCVDDVSDDPPSGTPDTVALTPTPNVKLKAPKLALTYSSGNKVKLDVTKLSDSYTDASCTLALYAGKSRSKATTLIKSYPLSSKIISKGLHKQASNIKVDGTKLTSIAFKAVKSCYSKNKSSNTVTLTLSKSRKGSIKTISKLASTLKKKLK